MLAERLAECLKSLIFKDFMHFIPLIPLMQKCIEKTRFCRGWGRGGSVGRVGAVFPHMRKCGKNFTKCLIFNGFLHSAIFPQFFRILYANLPFAIKDAII
jgi:hypothetical protein